MSSLPRKSVEFTIPTKKVLNSNRMPANVHVKSSLASALRTMAQESGIENHDDKVFAQNSVTVAKNLADQNTLKSRIRKRMRKAGCDEAEIDEAINKALKDIVLDELMDSQEETTDVDIDNKEVTTPIAPLEKPFMFNRFVVVIEVLPPTRRRSDPPNLYPTVKALVDGLTDAGWWEDDDYTKLVQMSFRHGGLSGVKDIYKVVLHIIEVDDKWIDELMLGGVTS